MMLSGLKATAPTSPPPFYCTGALGPLLMLAPACLQYNAAAAGAGGEAAGEAAGEVIGQAAGGVISGAGTGFMQGFEAGASAPGSSGLGTGALLGIGLLAVAALFVFARR